MSTRFFLKNSGTKLSFKDPKTNQTESILKLLLTILWAKTKTSVALTAKPSNTITSPFIFTTGKKAGGGGDGLAGLQLMSPANPVAQV